MKSSDEQEERSENNTKVGAYLENRYDFIKKELLSYSGELQVLRHSFSELESRVVLLEKKIKDLEEFGGSLEVFEKKDSLPPVNFKSGSETKEGLNSDNFSFIIKKLEHIMEANDFRRVYTESEDLACEIIDFSHGNNERVAEVLEAIRERILSLCFENPKDFENLEERFRIYVNFLDNQIMIEMWLCNFMDFIYKQRFIGRYSSVKSVFEYIDGHIKEFINMIAITENCHLSQQYLLRLFKERMNMSALEYIQSRKMMMAKWYLYFEEYSTSDVALKLGYVDAGYFSKVFRKYVGLTPHQYRLKVRGR